MNRFQQYVEGFKDLLNFWEDDAAYVKEMPANPFTQARKADKVIRICFRNLMNKANGGFISFPPNQRAVEYTSQRGQRRRYQLGRS